MILVILVIADTENFLAVPSSFDTYPKSTRRQAAIDIRSGRLPRHHRRAIGGRAAEAWSESYLCWLPFLCTNKFYPLWHVRQSECSLVFVPMVTAPSDRSFMYSIAVRKTTSISATFLPATLNRTSLCIRPPRGSESNLVAIIVYVLQIVWRRWSLGPASCCEVERPVGITSETIDTFNGSLVLFYTFEIPNVPCATSMKHGEGICHVADREL